MFGLLGGVWFPAPLTDGFYRIKSVLEQLSLACSVLARWRALGLGREQHALLLWRDVCTLLDARAIRQMYQGDKLPCNRGAAMHALEETFKS